MVEVRSAIADTFAGRVHIEWDAGAPVTPFGQLPFFIDYLKQAGLFDAWVADCPLAFSSPNAPWILRGSRFEPVLYEELYFSSTLVRMPNVPDTGNR